MCRSATEAYLEFATVDEVSRLTPFLLLSFSNTLTDCDAALAFLRPL